MATVLVHIALLAYAAAAGIYLAWLVRPRTWLVPAGRTLLFPAQREKVPESLRPVVDRVLNPTKEAHTSWAKSTESNLERMRLFSRRRMACSRYGA